MRSVQQGIFLILIVACLLGASFVQRDVDLMRSFIAGSSFLGDAPSDPQIVLLTHLLGGFKGLLVDAIWLRAGKLQLEEKFWELYQLYDWMGKLEPHLEKTWVFNAWNMSYNLVAELDDSEARWQWVQRGLDYLRKDGLKYNPQSAEIMRQISFIFHHKIGKESDLHHFYYKHRFALGMHAVMGDRDMQDMKGASEAPEDLGVLLKDRDVAYALREFDLNPKSMPVALLGAGKGIFGMPPSIHAALFKKKAATTSYGEFLAVSEGRAARKVINYIVAKTLREEYGMKHLAVAYALEKEFGSKFDWRLPDAHAMYWGKYAGLINPKYEKQIDYDRMVLYSMSQSFRRGRIAYMTAYVRPPGKARFITTWDFTKVRPLDELYTGMRVRYPLDVPISEEARGSESIRDGHTQFLAEATFHLYFAGYQSQAAHYFNKSRKLYNKPADPNMTLEAYVIGRVEDFINEAGSYEKVKAFIQQLIYQSLFHYCTNEFDTARDTQQLAYRAWDAFSNYDAATKEGRFHSPANLPTWHELRREIIRGIITGQTPFPKRLIRVLVKDLNIDPKKAKLDLPHNLGVAPPPSSLSPGPK